MPSLGPLRTSALALGCLIVGSAFGCSVSNVDQSEPLAASGGSGAIAGGGRASEPGGGAGGTASRSKPTNPSAGMGGVSPVGTAGAAGLAAAGTGGAADPSASGAAGAPSGSEPPNDCALNDTCVSKCTVPTATCGIEAFDGYCEFAGFDGASTQVACGARAVVGTACCGGCGCVPVEVFFDGQSCWQGAPQCTYPAFAGLMFSPHAPTPADAPPFTPPTDVPGVFQLGAGGTGAGGSDAASGGIGFVAGGSSGASAGGSAGASGSDGDAAAGEGGAAGQTTFD